MLVLQIAGVLSTGAVFPAVEPPHVAFPVPDHVTLTLSSPAPREVFLRLKPGRVDPKDAAPELLLPPHLPRDIPNSIPQPLVPLLPPDLRLELEKRLTRPEIPLFRNPVYTEEDKRLFVKRFPLLLPDDAFRIIPAQPAEPTAPSDVEDRNPGAAPESINP